jgi:Protein of unknown function (DUF732)
VVLVSGVATAASRLAHRNAWIHGCCRLARTVRRNVGGDRGELLGSSTMKLLMMGVAAFAAITSIPPAHADSPDTLYDQYMISHHMVEGSGANCAESNPHCVYSSEFMLAEGHKVCSAFAQGYSERSLIGQLEGDPGPLSVAGTNISFGRAGAETIVYAAHHYLCP